MARAVPTYWSITGVAVVTGAARGNGAAIARRLAERGATVVLADLADSDVHQTTAALVADGYSAYAQPVDVSNEQSVETLAEVASGHGPIVAWVNNAGIIQRKDFIDLTLEDWDRMMAVNARGAFLGTRAAAKRMSRGGTIVNLSSISAEVALPVTSHYGASKGAVALLTRHAALELGPQGIRVNAVAPGTILTPMTEGRLADPAQAEKSLSRIPLKRVGVPEDVAGPVAFLCSDEAAYITGATIFTDGGYTAN